MYVIEVCSKDGNKIGYSCCANMETLCALTESYGFNFSTVNQPEGRTTGMVCIDHIIKEKTGDFEIKNEDGSRIVIRRIFVDQYVLIYDKTPKGSFNYSFVYENVFE